ncbi:MAG: hypothetical protein GY847_17935 [Proteobacteria bacterium]|nr:hypothetical protein [Pseudomonadota bacterium]
MDSASLAVIAEVMKVSSPWGILVFLIYYLYRMQEKKDRDTKTIYNRLIELVENQTMALTKVESALCSLKKVVDGLRRE